MKRDWCRKQIGWSDGDKRGLERKEADATHAEAIPKLWGGDIEIPLG